MLTDPNEIKIISNAKQKNIRDPKRSREHFINIFNDFFIDQNFKDSTFLDQGPGQYDFGELAKKKGAKKIYCIDNDEAVVNLGLYKGYEVEFANIKDTNFNTFNIHFDGLFNKFSMNCFWFSNESEHIKFITNINNLLTVDGWAWICPWNGISNKNLDTKIIKKMLNLQIDIFKSQGFDAFKLSFFQTRKYGVYGKVENNILFIKNLKSEYLNSLKKI